MRLDVASALRPHPLETVCGDASTVAEWDGALLCAIIDGVGHGPAAHAAAMALTACFADMVACEPVPCLQAMHEHARGGVGAAVGLVRIDTASGHLAYAGLGNTTARLCGRKDRHFVSHDGVVGQRMRTLTAQTAVLCPGDVVVLHTDGIGYHSLPEQLPAMFVRDAEYVAHEIVARFAKPHDDAACLVVRAV